MPHPPVKKIDILTNRYIEEMHSCYRYKPQALTYLADREILWRVSDGCVGL